MGIKEKAYQKYQLDWMGSHGKSLENLVDGMQDWWKENEAQESYSPKVAFEDFEMTGFSGEIWACFDEFLETEYQDMEYMSGLLNPDEYAEYLTNRACNDVISEFRGEFYFLSNFYPTPVYYNGTAFMNTEAAFQAQKDPKRAKDFSYLQPSEAKRFGRQVKLREDWEEVKMSEMFHIVLAKFQQNPDLAKKLLETGYAVLIEGNQWHDNIWGSCTCHRCQNQGANMLGQILMAVRHICRVTEGMKQGMQKGGIKNNVRN